MSFWSRLLGARAGQPAQATAPAPMAGPLPVPYLDARSALGLSAVWRCVTLIADAVADMPWQEWKGLDVLEPSRLVRRPLVTMTRREWTWRVVATEALHSTAYVLHTGGRDSDGVPWSLLPIPPDAITPMDQPDPWGLLPPTVYQVGDLEVPVDSLTIIRRAPFPGVPEYVHGILDIARTQFQAYLAADYAMARYWRGGGPIQTVITTDQELESNEADDIADRWLMMRSRGNDYPAVLGKGAKADSWGADPTKEASVEARREINADVGRYFGMPTRVLNAPAGDTNEYANVENDAVDILRYCLRGYMGPVEDAISDLLPGDAVAGRRMELDPSRFVQGDLESRSRAYPPLVTAKIITPDEARLKGFGLPPLAGGAGRTVQEPAPAPAVTTPGTEAAPEGEAVATGD